MKTSQLLPILRSQLQGELLALLYLHPDVEYTLTAAAKSIGASVRAVHHEVERLTATGLVQDRRNGNMRMISAAPTRLTRPLTELLALTYGPIEIVPRALAAVDGIREAYLYGSWARRYSGEPGPPPADVDVLVIGDSDLDDLDDAARTAEAALSTPVNITRILPARWDTPADDDGFLTDIRSKPLIQLETQPNDEEAAQ